MAGVPIHHTILAVDVERFGALERDDPIRVQLRGVVNRELGDVLTRGGIDPARRQHQDTGDGVLVVTSPDVSTVDVLDAVALRLAGRVRRYNHMASEPAQMRLRVVVHAGDFVEDEHGVAGDAVNFAFRLLNSDELRRRLAETDAPLVLLLSPQVYELVRQGHSDIDPEDCMQVVVNEKELRDARAWLYVPEPRHRPAGRAATGAEPRVRAAVRALATWLGALRPAARESRRAAVPLLATVLTALLVGGSARASPGPAAAGLSLCPAAVELRLLVTSDLDSVVRALAADFVRGYRSSHRCLAAHVTVTATGPADAAVQGILAGWRDTDLRDLGPEPDVWIPDSSAQVERVQFALARGQHLDVSLAPSGSVATSPVVVAVPEPTAMRLGWPTDLSWTGLLNRATQEGTGGIRLVRSSPLLSSASLHATMALYGAVGETANPPHVVEQALTQGGDDPVAFLCSLRDQDRPASAATNLGVVVAEHSVIGFNRGDPLGGACSFRTPAVPATPMRAFYPDGVPGLDFPYVLVNAVRWRSQARERVAMDLLRFLRDPAAQEELRLQGFRGWDGQRGDLITPSLGALPQEPDVPVRIPDGERVSGVLDDWERARRPANVLLAVDSSGSMQQPAAGAEGTRFEVAQRMVRDATDLLGGGDEVGLWAYAQFPGHPGPPGAAGRQELVPLGPTRQPVGGVPRRDLLLQRLAALRAGPPDASLVDVVEAGIQRLRATRSTEAADALLVLTDGARPLHAGETARLAVLVRGSDRPVGIFLIVIGPGGCDDELSRLLQRSGGACNAYRGDAGRALDNVAASLWGAAPEPKPQ